MSELVSETAFAIYQTWSRVMTTRFDFPVLAFIVLATIWAGAATL